MFLIYSIQLIYFRSILILPNSKSLMNWTSSVNAEPGIFSEVMQSLETLNAEDKHCNLCLDAMSLRKQIIWSDKYNKYVGYCDFGRELNLEETDTPAREALFFMLVSLNGKWKLPIGYVLQNKITAVTQAELVKNILKHSYSSGLTIWGITCDGAYTNTSMMKILGCNIGNSYSEIKCWFPHPITNKKVYFIPDACHNLKLARNTLGNCKVLKSNQGFIRWDHICNLHNIQQEIHLKFANKLSNSHINWYNNKMKVSYAAQTLSSSTADALHFLKQEKVSKFENINATEEYCRVIDNIFDFLNSKCIYSKNFKSPITKQNIHALKNRILPLIQYLYTLKFEDQPLHTSNKKTFILGFAIAVKSLFKIAKAIFVDSSLNFNYVLTYKFSQDHLELLFGQIRQRGGSNNNPNVIQLKTAIKQILLKNSLKLNTNGNCNTFDDDVMCSIFDFKWNKNVHFDGNESDDNDYNILNRFQLIDNLSPYVQSAKENILYYILGYIIMKIITKIECDSCRKCLFNEKSDHNYHCSSTYAKFVNLRQNGGLISGSESAFKIIIEAEKVLLSLTNNLTHLNVPNLNKKIIYQCSNKLTTDHNIFSKLDCNSTILERPHKMVLITVLINRYLSIRLKSFSKQYSASINVDSKRQKYNKLVLFSNH